MALIAHWPLNGNTNDISGNNWNGTLKGSPTYVNGKIGQAISLNGSTQYVDIPTREYLKWRGQEFSVFLWVNLSSDDSDGSIISKPWNGGGQYNYRIYNGTNNVGVYLLGTQGYSLATPSGSIIKDVWNHIGFTVNSTTLKIYINGVKVSEANHGITAWVPSAGDSTESLAIGTLYPYGTFNQPTHAVKGLFNDVRLYDHVLTDFEIQEIARAKILHYTFDDFQEPTTNYINNGDFPGGVQPGNETYTSGTKTLVTGILNPINSAYVLINNQTAGATSEYNIYMPNLNLTGKITYSAWVWVSADYNGSGFLHSRWWNTSDAIIIAPSPGSVPTERNKWVKISYTVDPGTDTISRGYWYFGYPFQATAGFVYVTGFQLENKEYATDFIRGSRAGQVKDYSGFFNHSDAMTETNTPQWTPESKIGLGAYYLDNASAANRYMTKSSFNSPSNITMMCWFKKTADGLGTYHIPMNIDGAYYELSLSTSGNFRIGFYIDGVRRTLDHSSSTYVNGNWHMFAGSFDGTTIKSYVDGIMVNSTSAYPGVLSQASRTVYIGKFGTSPTYAANGYIDDVRIYATALSDKDILDIYQTRAEVEESGILYVRDIVNTKVKTLIINYTNWVSGTSGSQVGFNQNGDGNSIVTEYDTHGKLVPIWQSLNNDITSNADGGWNSTSFPINNTKLYRFSVWIKRKVLGDGSFYFGLYGYGSVNGVYRNSDGVTNDTNPYFISGSWTRPLDEWVLFVAHVFPYNHTSTSNHQQSGIYTVAEGKVGNISRDFRWRIETTTAVHRSYLYYSTIPETHQLWVYPRVDIIDGTEPTIGELLDGFDSKNFDYIEERNGVIKDSFEVQDRLTTVSDISTIGITDGLVGYWNLGKNSKDYSGNGYLSTDTNMLYNGDSAIFGGTSFITLSSSIFLNSNQNFTVSYLVKTSSTATQSTLSNLSGGPVYNDFRIVNGYPLFYHYDGSWLSEQANTQINDGEWHLLTWVNYSNETMDIFVDGSLDKNVSSAISSTGPVNQIGKNWTTNYFIGELKNFKIFNRALTAEEVKLEYNTMLNNEVQIHESGILYAKDLIQY